MCDKSIEKFETSHSLSNATVPTVGLMTSKCRHRPPKPIPIINQSRAVARLSVVESSELFESLPEERRSNVGRGADPSSCRGVKGRASRAPSPGAPCRITYVRRSTLDPTAWLASACTPLGPSSLFSMPPPGRIDAPFDRNIEGTGNNCLGGERSMSEPSVETLALDMTAPPFFLQLSSNNPFHTH